MRICIVYDCLFPYTVGGAERWYRNLAERLAAEGHEVTYLTLRQWERGERPRASPGVRVVAVGPRMALYTAGAAPAILPPLVFGLGRAPAPAAPRAPLRRRAHRVVPVLLAARRRRRAAARGATGSSSTGSRSGRAPTGASTSAAPAGAVGWRGPAAVRAGPAARVLLLRLHAARLREEGLRGDVTVLRGRVRGRRRRRLAERAPSRRSSSSPAGTSRRSACPRVVPAIARGARADPGAARRDLRRRPRARRGAARAIAAHGPRGRRSTRRASSTRERSRRRCAARCACCCPRGARATGWSSSRRPRAGTPSVVVAGADNAAVELVEEGVNGVVAPSADRPRTSPPRSSRRTTGAPRCARRRRRGSRRQREGLSLEASLDAVLGAYDDSARR